MNPLLLLTFEELGELDEFDAALPAALELDEDELVLPVEEPVDEVEELDATVPEPGADPTLPLTVITVAAIGEVKVQSANVACAEARFVVAVATAMAPCVVEASACVTAVCALVICSLSFSLVLASEFCAWVSDDCVCAVGDAL
jgi:hypothetical protein